MSETYVATPSSLRPRASRLVELEEYARFAGVSKTFEDGNEVFKDLDFVLGRGELSVVIGGSGSGKSTLLRVLLGLEGYDRGSVQLLGPRQHRAGLHAQLIELLQIHRGRVALGRRQIHGKPLLARPAADAVNPRLIGLSKCFYTRADVRLAAIRLVNKNGRIRLARRKLNRLSHDDSGQRRRRAASLIEQRANERHKLARQGELTLLGMPAAGKNNDAALAERPVKNCRLAVIKPGNRLGRAIRL